MLEHNSGHQFLAGELWPSRSVYGGVRLGVDVMRQDTCDTGSRTPSPHRRASSANERENRSRILEPKVSWLHKLFGFEIGNRLTRVEARIDNLEQAFNELADDL